mgnify:CR=1 FL=1
MSREYYKCTNKVSTMVPEELESAFERKAHELDCTPSELLRDAYCLVVHGMTFVDLVANSRRNKVIQQEVIEAQLRGCKS